MNIKSLRKALEVAKTTNLTPGTLTSGLANHYNVEGILATVLKSIPYGSNCMLTQGGTKIFGVLPIDDYDTLGLPQCFPSSYVWQCKGVSERMKAYFAGFETVSWITLDQLPKDDLLKVLAHMIAIEEQDLLGILELYVQSTSDGNITPVLFAYLGFINGTRSFQGQTEPAETLTPKLLREIGLRPIFACDVYNYRHALELNPDQLLRTEGGGSIPDWHELTTYWLLRPEQISTFIQILAEVGQYSPQSQSRM
jgi:hypothetical protein